MSLDLKSPALARILPFGLFIVLLSLATFMDGLWSDRLHAMRGPIVAVVLALLWRRYSELHTLGTTPARAVGGGIGMGLLVFVLWIALDQPWFRFGDGTGSGFAPVDANGDLDLRLAAGRLFALVIVVPVMEELFWRSFLLRWLTQSDFLMVRPATITLRAQLIGAAVFALEHELWLAGLVAGLAYGWLYARTGSLWTVILAHALTNGLLGIYIVVFREWRLW